MINFKAAIIEFAQAHQAAEDNPKLLIKDSTKYSDLCVARMNRTLAADAKLFDCLALYVNEQVHSTSKKPPIELLTFWSAEADKGCTGCWISSNTSGKHPECEEKIRLWFKAQKALVVYGLSLIPK